MTEWTDREADVQATPFDDLLMGEDETVTVTPTDWGDKLRALADDIDKQIAYCGDDVVCITLARGPRAVGIISAVVCSDWDDFDDEDTRP